MKSPVLTDPETVAFLARRLLGQAGSNGLSSDAMISAAAVGVTPPDTHVPHDLGDFGRCCEAFVYAPYDMRKRMLPILAGWAASLVDHGMGA